MNKKLNKIEKRIDKIKTELGKVGEMRPGSLSKQYNVCGKPSCKCKDPDKPRKHGPYFQLSYVHKGKSTSQFIRKEFVTDAQQQIRNYKRFKALTTEWVDIALEHARLKLEIARETEPA